MEPIFFLTPADFRKWLAKNHQKETALLVGFYKRGSSRPGITWSDSVDEALCYGWIDGVTKSLDAERYTKRFSPRKPGSIWSKINIEKIRVLTEAGKMKPAGLAAFAARKESKSGIYAYEQEQEARLSPAEEKAFKANKKAWAWFNAAAPSYCRTAIHWVTRAKKEETRARRLVQLIEDSAAGMRAKPYRL